MNWAWWAYLPVEGALLAWWLGLTISQRYVRAWAMTYTAQGWSLLCTMPVAVSEQPGYALVTLVVAGCWTFMRWLHTSEGPRQFLRS